MRRSTRSAAQLREAAQTGDFERVLSWAVGLSSPGCLRLTAVANPARLAIDVRAAPPTAGGVRGRADQRRGAASTIQWLAATALAASHWSWRTRRNARSRHAFQLGSPSPATVLAKTSSAAARTVTRRCGREARNRPRPGTWPTSPSDTAWPSSSRGSTASCSLMTCSAEAAGRTRPSTGTPNQQLSSAAPQWAVRWGQIGRAHV